MDFNLKVKAKYSYLSDDEVEYFVNQAKSILIANLYPADLTINYSTYQIPKRYDIWILQCIDELIERRGISSVVGYSENGMSFDFDGSRISKSLLKEITPIAGGIR